MAPSEASGCISHEDSQMGTTSSSCGDVDTPCDSSTTGEGDSEGDSDEDDSEDDNENVHEDVGEENGGDDEDEVVDEQNGDGSRIVGWVEGVYIPGWSRRGGTQFEEIDLSGL